MINGIRFPEALSSESWLTWFENATEVLKKIQK
jgi:hypothetical protein